MNDSDIYACARCGAFDCKLWRPYSTFRTDLKCVDCACLTVNPDRALDASEFIADGSRPKPGYSDLPDAPYMARRSWDIEQYVPAVQASSGGYYGYGAIPMDPWSPGYGDWLAWVALPLRMPS